MGEREEEEEDDMKEAYNVFDQNGDGFITVEELRSVLALLGIIQDRTVEDCKMMIDKVDADGDGRVSYKEFRQMMKGGEEEKGEKLSTNDLFVRLCKNLLKGRLLLDGGEM